MASFPHNINRLPDEYHRLNSNIKIHKWDISSLASSMEAFPTTVMSVLDEREKAKAERYKNFSAFAHFVLSRYLLKSELSTILGCERSHVRISYGQYGKPFIDGCPINFNLSHSDGLVALALSSSPVGIDIERKRKLDDPEVLAREFLSAAEQDWLNTISNDAKSEAILSIWTMKEAILKAWGCGLSFTPKRLTVIPAESTIGNWSIKLITTNPYCLVSIAGLA